LWRMILIWIFRVMWIRSWGGGREIDLGAIALSYSGFDGSGDGGERSRDSWVLWGVRNWCATII
jgi:hypothetical protein